METASELFDRCRWMATRAATQFRYCGYDLEDLEQVALLALWRSAVVYDPAKTPEFEPFAGFRMRGAVIDELRSRSPVKRADYSRGMRVQILALDDGRDAPSETELIDAIAQRAIVAAVESLDEKERALVRGHYYMGRRFDHVCADLGISKSWGSRIHKAALRKLQKRCAWPGAAQ